MYGELRKNFREFKKYIEGRKEELQNKKVAIYCTGGIRCEKAGPLMQKYGIDTYQLKGGILKYFEDTPASKWNGECFVFDYRVSLDKQLQPGSNELCFGCNMPLTPEEKKSPHYEIVVGIVWRGEEFYIQKRGEHGMLAGLWEFPGGKVKIGESLEDALYREIQEECGAIPKILKKIGTIKHAYTHFTITFHGYHCEENGRSMRCQQNSKWIKPNQIDEFPFPKANHKLFSILEKQGWDV